MATRVCAPIAVAEYERNRLLPEYDPKGREAVTKRVTGYAI